MEMLQLRYFYESAKNGSFTKTAQKYMVPQTSVSAAIKRLEKELGTNLFDRSSNRIELNAKGQLMLETLEEVFEKIDSAVRQVTGEKLDKRVIKILVCALREQVTNKIVAYKTKNPDVTFKTVFDFDEAQFPEYDIIIDEKNDKYPMYECIEILTSKVTLCASENSPLRGKKLTLTELKNAPFISIGENNGLTKILVNACLKRGFSPNFVVQSNDLSCTKKCVESGIGIGVVRVDGNEQFASNLCYLDVLDFNETQTLCLYYKKSAAYGNVKHFLEFFTGRDL